MSTTRQPEDDQHPAILRGDAGVAFLRYGIMPWGGFGIPMDRGLPDADVAAETFLT